MLRDVRRSLGLKSILLLCSVLIFFFSLMMVMNVSNQRRLLLAKGDEEAVKTAEIIAAAIRHPMLQGDQDVIQLIFDGYGKERKSDTASLVDDKGMIRRSSGRAYIGRHLDADDRAALSLGQGKREFGTDPLTGRQIYEVIKPVRNERSCHGCHGGGKKMLGALVVDLEMEPVLAEIRKISSRNILLSLLGIVATCVLTVYFLLKVIVLPIKKLERGMNRVSDGDFDDEIAVTREDEIGSLTRLFNKMTRDLKYYLEREKLSLEKEQEKKEELEALNRNLQEEVNERVQAEKFLRESEEKYSSLVESAQEGVIMIQDEVLKFVNPAMARMVGFERDEMRGRPFWEFVEPDQRSVFRERYMMRMAGMDAAQRYEIGLQCRDGSLKQAEVSAVVIRYQDEPTDMVIIRDITERKKQEQKLLCYSREVIQASKMAAMGQLAAGISHELNQPLTGIKGFAQAILCGQVVPSAVKDDLQKIIDQADRMDKIISNVRFFARKSEYAMDEIDINGPIQDSVQLLEAQLKVNNVTVRTSLAAGLPRILGDSNQLQQVFLNLLTNARDALVACGRAEGSEIVITTLGGASGVEVYFKDNGCGIPDSNVESIFNPFFTTKSPNGGVGLGLAIVYRIIEEHGGRIKVESTVGEGTCFIISLPYREK
ncbi:MAG: ATP-binding protein [Deltaproteobacteria bacterium]